MCCKDINRTDTEEILLKFISCKKYALLCVNVLKILFEFELSTSWDT